MPELDLLIIGAYYGKGRRHGCLSHFLLGVAVPSDNPGQSCGTVLDVGDFSLYHAD